MRRSTKWRLLLLRIVLVFIVMYRRYGSVLDEFQFHRRDRLYLIGAVLGDMKHRPIIIGGTLEADRAGLEVNLSITAVAPDAAHWRPSYCVLVIAGHQKH